MSLVFPIFSILTTLSFMSIFVNFDCCDIVSLHC